MVIRFMLGFKMGTVSNHWNHKILKGWGASWMALTLPFHQDCLLVFSFVVHFSIRLAFVNASQLPSLSTCRIVCSIHMEMATYWYCEQRHICLHLATFSLFPWPVYNFLLYVSCKKSCKIVFCRCLVFSSFVPSKNQLKVV